MVEIDLNEFQAFISECNRVRDKVDNISGRGVRNSHTSISIDSPDDGGDVWPNQSPWKPVQLTSIISSEPGRYNGKSISGAAKNNATGALAVADIGTVAGMEDCIVWNLRETGHGGHAINLGDNAQCVLLGLFWGMDKNSKKPIFMVGADPGVFFRVNLTQTGGSLGNKTTKSSWTYTANIPGTSTALGTSLSPETGRTNGTLAAATKGVGYYDASGTFVLYSAAELIGTAGCS